MASRFNFNSWPALKHLSGTLFSDTAAAVANDVIYKAIWFNVAGTLDVVDTGGTKVKVIGSVGSVYPCQSFGAVTGGNTTLSAGDFNYLSE
jgi:hypothetical protein